MASFEGLYYPYIHFQDEGWLKTALLYWDTMSRIVPDDVKLDDTPVVRIFSGEGIVENISPDRASNQVGQPFKQLISSYGEKLEKKFGLTDLSDDNLSLIHGKKFDSELASDLSKLKIAKCLFNKWGEPEWIGVHPKLARVYMTALAEEVSKEIGARPVVDNVVDHVSISGLTLERLIELLFEPIEGGTVSSWWPWRWPLRGSKASAKRVTSRSGLEIEQAMATLAFRYVVPANPANIPVLDIIAFRNDFREERRLFQTEIEKIVKELDYLKDVNNVDDFSRHLQNEYRMRLEPKVERLAKGMRDANWDVAESAIAASYAVPAGIVAAVAALSIGLPAELGTAASIGVAGWKIWRKHKKDEENVLKPSAEAYLYRMKTALSPAALANEVKAVGSQA